MCVSGFSAIKKETTIASFRVIGEQQPITKVNKIYEKGNPKKEIVCSDKLYDLKTDQFKLAAIRQDIEIIYNLHARKGYD